jgi:hypothetical protein
MTIEECATHLAALADEPDLTTKVDNIAICYVLRRYERDSARERCADCGSPEAPRLCGEGARSGKTSNRATQLLTNYCIVGGSFKQGIMGASNP